MRRSGWTKIWLMVFLLGASSLVFAQQMSLKKEYQAEKQEVKLLNDTVWNGDNWTRGRRRFQLRSMFFGRVTSVSKAFETCVKDAVAQGSAGIGPYYYCKGDPHKDLSKSKQALKALKVARTFYNVKVKYEPNGSGNAHHHGGGGYNDADQYFHWAGWFGRVQQSLDLKICQDSRFCQNNPGSSKCSSNTRSQGNCRWEGFPWPYRQSSGIAWHEVMHHHGYGHGANNQNDAPSGCGTTDIPNWHFQNNTMPYIVDKCMSRVIRRSGQRCNGGVRAGSGALRLIDDFNSWSCEIVQDPKRKGVQLVAQHSNKCVDVYWNSLEDEANVNQWACNSTGAQRFNLRYWGRGYYEVVNRTSGKCLDVAKSRQSNGANVIQYECNQTTNQLWKLKDVGRGYYQLRAMHSGKCLDVTSSQDRNGANIIQWKCNNTTNQRFRIRGLYHSKDMGSDLGDRFFQMKDDYFTGIFGRSGALMDKFGLYNERRRRTDSFGGNGGRFFRERCPRGTRIIGFYGRQGARIDKLGAICGTKSHRRKTRLSAHGGNGGSGFSFTCKKGFWIKKVQGLSNNLVNRLTFFCGH